MATTTSFAAPHQPLAPIDLAKFLLHRYVDPGSNPDAAPREIRDLQPPPQAVPALDPAAACENADLWYARGLVFVR